MKTNTKPALRAVSSILLLFLLFFLPLSCNQTEENPVEGAWDLIYAKSVSNAETSLEFPGDVTGKDMKMWSESHFIFVGYFDVDSIHYENYGCGTYTLEGNHYTEMIQYHVGADYVGQEVKMLVEVSNDTLTQTWPVDDEWNVDTDNYRIEKYVRLD